MGLFNNKQGKALIDATINNFKKTIKDLQKGIEDLRKEIAIDSNTLKIEQDRFNKFKETINKRNSERDDSINQANKLLQNLEKLL